MAEEKVVGESEVGAVCRSHLRKEGVGHRGCEEAGLSSGAKCWNVRIDKVCHHNLFCLLKGKIANH